MKVVNALINAFGENSAASRFMGMDFCCPGCSFDAQYSLMASKAAEVIISTPI